MSSRPLLVLICGCALAGPAVAGSLNAPAAPTDAGSAMYTLSSLCVRLATGATGAPRSTVFVEPAAGPGATPCTLNEIMAWMPAVDASGAAPAEVRSGKTFWGLTSGAWGLRTGTVPAGTNVTGADGQGVIPIPDGIYAGGKTVTASDSDLTAGNLKVGVNLFGTTGTYTGVYVGPKASFPVAKTGQTTAYATGDDGHLEKGVAWPNPRFTDHGNGTVTDNLTGLVWLKNANCAGTMVWTAAMTWAAALASPSCGLSDGSVAGQWRLPTVKELSSLIHRGTYNPALPAGHPFAGVQSLVYWSSTSNASGTDVAWLVFLAYGNVLWNYKSYAYYVWPVRGGL